MKQIYSTMFSRLSLGILVAVLFVRTDVQAGPSSDDPDRGGSPPESPYDPLLARLRSIETNAVAAADGDFLLSYVGKFDNLRLDQRLRATAAAVFVCSGQFAKYRQVRTEIFGRQDFESAVLEACPNCGGKGEQTKDGETRSPCKKCRGAGWRVKDRVAARKRLGDSRSLAINEVERSRNKFIREKEEKDRKEEALRLQKEREETERRLKIEQEERERRLKEEREAEERRKAEEFARQQRAKGLVLYNGRWMTPAERLREQRLDRFRAFVADRSIVACRFHILQVIGDGRALCVNDLTGNTFCILYATDSAHNRAIADGDRFVNNLYWCGTYSYTTVRNASARVPLYAIDIERAIVEAIAQGFYED